MGDDWTIPLPGYGTLRLGTPYRDVENYLPKDDSIVYGDDLCLMVEGSICGLESFINLTFNRGVLRKINYMVLGCDEQPSEEFELHAIRVHDHLKAVLGEPTFVEGNMHDDEWWTVEWRQRSQSVLFSATLETRQIVIDVGE